VTYEMVDAAWPSKYFRDPPAPGIDSFGTDDVVHLFKREFNNTSDAISTTGQGGKVSNTTEHTFHVTLKRTFLPPQLRVFTLQFRGSWLETPAQPQQKQNLLAAYGPGKSGSGVKSALVTASRVGGSCGTVTKRERVVKFLLPEAGQ